MTFKALLQALRGRGG